MSKVEKNRKKTGGRKKGTPNKKTLEFAAELEKLDFNAVQKAVELYHNTDEDGVKANILTNFFKYLYPQRKAIDVDYAENANLTVNINSKTMNDVYNKLQML